MDIAGFTEAVARTLFGLELTRDLSTRQLARRLAEVIDCRSHWTFQKWFYGEVEWEHEMDLVWAALFVALGKEVLLGELLPHLNGNEEGRPAISADEWRRVRRVAQMFLRGRYAGPHKTRFINQADVHYLCTGEMPGGRYLPLCASSGPPYVSPDDVEQLDLFTLSTATGESVAFSYLDPIGAGLPGQSLDIHGVVEEFKELPGQPAEYSRDRMALLYRAWRAARQRDRAFEDRMGLALVGVEPVLTESWGDAQTAVALKLQFSDYFRARATNGVLDEIIGGRVLMPAREEDSWKIIYRDEWCGSMASFTDPLANLLQVNGLVITTGDPGPPQVHLANRGVGVATNPRQTGTVAYSPSFSGAAAQGRYGGRKEIDFDLRSGEIKYDPEVTMLREGAEEVWGRETGGGGRPFPESWDPRVRFLGLSRVFTSYDPFLFGHIELNAKAAEFKDFVLPTTDKFDVESLHSIPLDPDGVVAFAQVTSPIVHGNTGPTVSVVLFMLYHEICFRYPEVVADFKRRYVAALTGGPGRNLQVRSKQKPGT